MTKMRGVARHCTPEKKAVALENEIFRCQVGSGVHGTAIEGTDDRDEMGVCIEPHEFIIGNKQFDQYIWRTQPEHTRSGAGDLDLTVYGLRKFLGLAMAGNPSILVTLFVPPEEVVLSSPVWDDLMGYLGNILSQQAGERFLGYLREQKKAMLGERSPGVTRPELIEQYGFDTKFAGHAVRLGLQGIELLSTGKITLPMPHTERYLVRSIRKGGFPQEAVLTIIDELEEKLRYWLNSPDRILRSEPDWAWANEWLYATYTSHWAKAGGKHGT